MHSVLVPRESARVSDLTGRVLCHELRGADGRVAIAKGRVMDAADAERALTLAWSELHLLALDRGDVHENDAGDRIARCVAGSGVTVLPPSAGHWPLGANARGVLQVETVRLERVNALDGPCVYSLYDGQIVEAGETVARAKIIPFAIRGQVLADVESIFADEQGAIRVREFVPHRVGAVVHQSLGERAVDRFRDAVTEKLAWFGSALCALETTLSNADAMAAVFDSVRHAGVNVILVAGAKAMDALDPTFSALEKIGARMVVQGVPGHPGSLLWLAEWENLPIIGMPTCGLFAQATVFDLVIARLLTGERLGRRQLASLGHGGFLTRDMAFRLPAYRRTGERGTVE